MEEEEGGAVLSPFLSFTWPAFSFLDDQIQWLRGRGENCYHRVKSQGKKEKKRKKEIEREQQQLSDGLHSRNNKERLSRHLVRLLFSLLSLSLSRWVAQLGQQTGKQKGERKKKKKRVWLLLLLLCGIEEEREKEQGCCWVWWTARVGAHHATTRSQRIEIVFSFFFSVCLFGRWIELTPAIRRFSFPDGRVQRTLCPHKVFSHLVCSCFLSS